MEFSKEIVTPKKAASMLGVTEKKGFTNRSLSSPYVLKYARDMGAGNWYPDTGETLKITNEGVVVDGQHRLHAIIKADISVPMWVCRGIKKDMAKFVDGGQSRDLKAIMELNGWRDARLLAVVGKMIWRYDHCGEAYGQTSGFSAAEGNIYDWLLASEPGLQSQWDSQKKLIRKCYTGVSKSIPETTLFYLLYQWSKEDSGLADEIFGYFSSGSQGLPPHPSIGFFKDYAIELKMLDNAGKRPVTKNRQTDVKEILLSAADYAWSLTKNKKRSITYNGFKSGFGQKLAKTHRRI